MVPIEETCEINCPVSPFTVFSKCQELKATQNNWNEWKKNNKKTKKNRTGTDKNEVALFSCAEPNFKS